LDNDEEGVSKLAFVGDENWKDEIFLFGYFCPSPRKGKN